MHLVVVQVLEINRFPLHFKLDLLPRVFLLKLSELLLQFFQLFVNLILLGCKFGILLFFLG